MIDFNQLEVWFATGSQDLYGEETLKQVSLDSQEICRGLNADAGLPVKIVFKPILKTPEAIYKFCLDANSSENCIGIMTWMHTFSPARMWIRGLSILNKPILHFHTQFNRDIPYSEIDMDFMNLNQSAHGGREYGFMLSRMRKNRKVVVGHWQNPEVQRRVNVWMRAAAAWFDWQGAKIARFGDNMREVAVTEGDKVAAQLKFGYAVNGYGIGDLVKYINEVGDSEIDKLCDEYTDLYDIIEIARKGNSKHENIRVQARIELGMRNFLSEGNFKGFTTTFQDLHGLKQLPGLAVQRLMADGYGFGAEGDWKQSALVRAMKVMGLGLEGGCSFMEDYTYHFNPAGMKVLGSHMLEICPSIKTGKAKLEVHHLGIGGKEDPARLVFNVPNGSAINASMLDMGNRFRLLINNIDCVSPDAELPKLPVARAMWVPQPNLPDGAAAWILAGGAHHSSFSQAVTAEYMEDFAEMADIEFMLIDNNTRISEFKKELKWNDMYYLLSNGLK